MVGPGCPGSVHFSSGILRCCLGGPMQLKTILAIRHKKFSLGELGAGETSFAEDKSPWLRNSHDDGL